MIRHTQMQWQPQPHAGENSHMHFIHSHMQGNTWQRLWSATAAQAVSQQQPLLKAEMQAERVFHDLENIPPQALWDQLLTLAAVAAASMLSLCPGARLPPAQQRITQ